MKRAKYYSIIFDTTPDTAHLEQLSQIIRYVHFKNDTCSIEESFIDFIVSHKKTGKGLSEEILRKLSENYGLVIRNCRGQSFDNAANMAGKYEGVQAHINERNELVPCAAHSLNLVGVHTASSAVVMISFLVRFRTSLTFLAAQPHDGKH